MSESQKPIIKRSDKAILLCLLVAIIAWSLFDAYKGLSEKYAANTIAEEEARRVASLTPKQIEQERLAKQLKAEADARIAAAQIEQKARENKLAGARGACLISIRKILHDPDSADFGLTSDWLTGETSAGTIVVLTKVRAKNGFGAYRLGGYRCEVLKTTDGFRLIALDEV